MAERVPNGDKARIDPRKLRDYALNPEHISGRHKAEFFVQMGYSADDWQRLERDIREQHLSQLAEPGQESPFGRKFTITAPLQGPQGLARQVTTVWMIKTGKDFPELVTIFPAARKKDGEDGNTETA